MGILKEMKEKVTLCKTIWRLDLSSVLSTKQITVVQGKFMELWNNFHSREIPKNVQLVETDKLNVIDMILGKTRLDRINSQYKTVFYAIVILAKSCPALSRRKK